MPRPTQAANGRVWPQRRLRADGSVGAALLRGGSARRERRRRRRAVQFFWGGGKACGPWIPMDQRARPWIGIIDCSLVRTELHELHVLGGKRSIRSARPGNSAGVRGGDAGGAYSPFVSDMVFPKLIQTCPHTGSAREPPLEVRESATARRELPAGDQRGVPEGAPREPREMTQSRHQPPETWRHDGIRRHGDMSRRGIWGRLTD